MIPGPEPRRILLIRRRALGDALVTLPAVAAVRQAWPQAEVDLVVDRPFAPLLADLGPSLRVLAWPPPAGEPWLRRLRGAGYDLVVDWLGNPRTAIWTALTGARLRVGYDLPRRSWAYNVRVPRNRSAGRPVRAFAGEAFLDPLRVLGLEPAPWRAGHAAAWSPGAGLGADYVAWRDRWREGRPPAVALVMSATWPAKAWPAEHAVELVRLLTGGGFEPLLVPGPGDGTDEAVWRRCVSAERVAPPTNLTELADLLAGCRLLVGTDNGARHLAAILGRPTVTLFGPTDAVGWNPASSRHVSLRTGVPCSPCDLEQCPVAGHPCLDDLLPVRVAAAVAEITTRDRGSG